MICDAHCHLDLMENMLEFINEIQNSNISLFAVGTTPKAYDREVQFCKSSRNIYVGLGMHPQLVSSGYDDMLLFESLAVKSHYIGEIGLDFSKAYIHTKDLQIKVFREIIELCEQYGEKIVSIHSLKSVSMVLKILQECKRKESNKYILHWFTGSISQLERAIELGCYFSINPNMLKTKSGVEIIKKVPASRMLLETDAPFAIKSKHLCETEKKLKKTILEISNITGMDVDGLINKNSREVFQY